MPEAVPFIPNPSKLRFHTPHPQNAVSNPGQGAERFQKILAQLMG